MTDEEAMDEVQYPIVSLPSGFRDERGIIQNLFVNGMQSGALITSKKSSRRADHYHKTGGHLCLLLDGQLTYRWRPVGSSEEPKSVTITKGTAFYTPSGVEHSMYFDEDSVFLSFDPKVSRTAEGYANDTVKLTQPL